MALIVWITIGAAIWHFTVFFPDRFKGAIAGAFVAAVVGGVISGALVQLLMDRSLGETDMITVLAAVPGSIALLALDWVIGAREDTGFSGTYGDG